MKQIVYFSASVFTYAQVAVYSRRSIEHRAQCCETSDMSEISVCDVRAFYVVLSWVLYCTVFM